MKIGIDISQLAYPNTGVANYLGSLIQSLLNLRDKNQYILYGSSLRQSIKYKELNIKYKNYKNVKFKILKLPPLVMDFLWNKLHIFPVEWLIGDVDIFISSDWTEPPVRRGTKHRARTKKATILYDLIVYKYPEESHSKTEFNLMKLLISPNIVASQKRKLKWVKKESDIIFCISESTKKDAMEILGIEEKRLKVIYPGI